MRALKKYCSLYCNADELISRSSKLQSYATFEGEPLVKKRSLFTRLLLWTTTGTTVFYGVSTVVALNNQQYQDWFSESVPVSWDDLSSSVNTSD